MREYTLSLNAAMHPERLHSSAIWRLWNISSKGEGKGDQNLKHHETRVSGSLQYPLVWTQCSLKTGSEQREIQEKPSSSSLWTGTDISWHPETGRKHLVFLFLIPSRLFSIFQYLSPQSLHTSGGGVRATVKAHRSLNPWGRELPFQKEDLWSPGGKARSCCFLTLSVLKLGP